MGLTTGIEWTDHTFNPWWGCTKVSPACGMPLKGHEDEPFGQCYAETGSERFGFKIWGQDAERRFFGDKHWHEPFKWDTAAACAGIRRRVFCGSMCDVMEDRRDLDRLRGDLWQVIQSTPWLDWQLLTKRPQNYSRLLPERWIKGGLPRNVWLGTTVETQDYLWRVDALKAIPATIHFLSLEPLLGPLLPGLCLDGIEWAITGGESGRGARPSHPEWFRSVRDACQASGTAYFHKQWGEWGMTAEHGFGGREHLPTYTFSHGDGTGTEMIRVGKKAAGAWLDGREWRQMPEGARMSEAVIR